MTDDKKLEKQLANRLKEIREYNGYSQEDIGKHLGISRSAISLIESGVRKISAVELSKLATLYQRSIENLTNTKNDPILSESVQMVARAAAALSDEDRNEVLRFAELLKSKSANSGK